MSGSMDNEKINLNDFIIQHFSMGEVRDLCFQLGLDSDDLDGSTRSEKARELVEYLRRRGRLADLHVLLKRLRAEPYALAFPTITTTEISASSTPGLERDPRLVPSARAISPDRRIHAKTGIELIRIPAGPFLYGSADSDGMARDNEKPQRILELPEYWIGRFPVTNAEYKRFLDANPSYRVPSLQSRILRFLIDDKSSWETARRVFPEGKANHPVVQVKWEDAHAFCNWAGLVLPTEEQWEKAARGTDGRIWPWGNAHPTAEHCNFNLHVSDTTSVGQYSPQGDSPFGCADMAGNVWEQAGSRYREDEVWTLRGGAWDSNVQTTRAGFRLGNFSPVRIDSCLLYTSPIP